MEKEIITTDTITEVEKNNNVGGKVGIVFSTLAFIVAIFNVITTYQLSQSVDISAFGAILWLIYLIIIGMIIVIISLLSILTSVKNTHLTINKIVLVISPLSILMSIISVFTIV
jgi:hypothetical protein